MIKVMLDTCVLVDFFLIYSKEDKKQKIPEHLKYSEKLLRLYESAKFFNVMSAWNKLELRNVAMNIKLEQKFIESGYSTREFGYARRDIDLETEEKKLVNQAVFDIWKYSIRETKDIDKTNFMVIENLSKKGFGFMDLILIIQAKKNECDFFITRDKKLKDLDWLSKQFNINIVGVKEFLSKLKKEKKLKKMYISIEGKPVSVENISDIIKSKSSKRTNKKS